MNMKRLLAIMLFSASLFSAGSAAAIPGEVLEEIRNRGFVRCSIDDTPGFGAVGENGVRQGLDVDFCRAVAAAVFDDPTAIELLRISTRNKFQALKNGEIDLVLGMTTWTLHRDTALGGNFTGVLYYDGQGFLGWKKDGLSDLASAGEATVCVQSDTTSAANLQDIIRSQKLALQVRAFGSSDERRDAFLRRDCDLTTGDLSGLAAFRAVSAPSPDSLILLPDIISREPLGPMVPDRDVLWFDIVKWTLQALILAEEKGLSREQAKSALASGTADLPDAELRRLVGHDMDPGQALSLKADWALRVISHTGNYGEIFSRNLGAASPLGLPRGQNALWRDGGLMYPWVFR